MPKALLSMAWLTCILPFGMPLEAQQPAYGVNIQGKLIHRLVTGEDKAVVLFFLASDCPISNRYAPEIQRLEKEFARDQITFWLVYPNATETAESVAQHEAAFGLHGPTLMHPKSWFIGESHATTTPEAAVLIPEGARAKVAYSGRIDDRYASIGKERPQASHHDLQEAVSAVLAGRPVSPAGGPPVGCGIVSEAALGKP
jgi:thiol-disulfide isomerase/thioredoxin